MKDKFTAVLMADCVTATRAGGSTFLTVLHNISWRMVTDYIPDSSGQHQDAADKSSSQTWGARPGSNVSSAADRRDCQTSLRRRRHHHGCHQSEEDHRHSCNERQSCFYNVKIGSIQSFSASKITILNEYSPVLTASFCGMI